MSEESGFTILVVDDEKSNINVLSKILGDTYKMLVTKNGETALKLAHEKTPDLILLDIVMPEMSGFEVLVALKNSEVTRAIPVIFITGLDSAKDEAKGFLLGAVDYITKPFDNTVVKARVSTHVQIVSMMRTIEKLTMLDPLTNIPNKRKFYEKLTAEWEKATISKTQISLIMVDIDYFKKYNDTYGHPQGDVLLKALAKILKDEVSSQAEQIARFGGEEFVILLNGCDSDTTFALAEKLRVVVGGTKIPFSGDNSLTNVTISAGVVMAQPSDGNTIEDLISRVDIALYTAKASGKNRVSK